MNSHKQQKLRPKPCPCCGGEVQFRGTNAYKMIYCPKCSVSTCLRSSEEEAVAIWNRRIGEETAKKAFVAWQALQDAVGHFIDEQNATTLSALCKALGKSIEARKQIDNEGQETAQ